MRSRRAAAGRHRTPDPALRPRARCPSPSLSANACVRGHQTFQDISLTFPRAVPQARGSTMIETELSSTEVRKRVTPPDDEVSAQRLAPPLPRRVVCRRRVPPSCACLSPLSCQNRETPPPPSPPPRRPRTSAAARTLVPPPPPPPGALWAAQRRVEPRARVVRPGGGPGHSHLCWVRTLVFSIGTTRRRGSSRRPCWGTSCDTASTRTATGRRGSTTRLLSPRPSFPLLAAALRSRVPSGN